MRSEVGVPGPNSRPMPLRPERVHVFGGNDAAAGHQHVGPPHGVEQLADPGEERHVGAGENREPDHVDVLLHRRGGDHLGRLVQPGVDDLHSRVAERRGDDLRAPVVAVEPRLGDEHPDRARQRPRGPEPYGAQPS